MPTVHNGSVALMISYVANSVYYIHNIFAVISVKIVQMDLGGGQRIRTLIQ